MQLAAFFNNRSGILVIGNDSSGGISDWSITPRKTLTIVFYGNQPDVLVIPIERSLFHIASTYRKWANKQFWIRNRVRTPIELEFISVAAGSSMDVDRSNLDHIYSLVPGRIGVWFTLWRNAPFDRMYPNYSPKENFEFKRILRDLKKKGDIAFPYINGLTWDFNNLPFRSQGEELGLLDTNSNFVPYKKSMSHLLYACPYSTEWQQKLLAARANLVDLDGTMTAGVYLDMLGATAPIICNASHHGHKPNDPYSWIDGVRELLRNTKGLIFIEGCAEVYLDLVDYTLMHFHTIKSDSVPLWKHVYGDLVAARGWRIPLNTSQHQFHKIIEEVDSFTATGKGSPWISVEHERELFKRNFHQIAFGNK